MKRISIFLFVFLGFQLFFAGDSCAWWSGVLNSGTHGQMVQDSFRTITSSDYPDLQKYISKIQSGSGKESHNTAQELYGNNNSLNGGLPKVWWDYATIDKYGNSQFSDAYENIGRMCHLIQDEAVPAHAANINHGLNYLHTDNLESAGKLPNAGHYSYPGSSAASQKIYGKRPDLYYDWILGLTFVKVTQSDMDPASLWRFSSDNAYWLTDDYDYDGPDGRGMYGGPVNILGNRTDVYTWDAGSGILAEQISDAIKYTGGSLMMASELLPPLIPAFTVSPDPVNSPAGNQILFTLMENRLPDVKIDLFVQETGQPIITTGLIKRLPYNQSDNGTEYYADSPDAITWTAKYFSLYPTLSSDLGLLPQMASFQLEWSGEVEGARLEPREEPYTLVIRVTDHDGNNAESSYNFTMRPDITPPTVQWTILDKDGTQVTQEVTGSNSLEIAPWFHTGYSTGTYISFQFQDSGTGVGNFSIYPPSATEEPVASIFSAAFHKGQSFLLSDFTLQDDATGYLLAATDSLGNATTVYFHLDRQRPEIHISTIVVHKIPGTYSMDVYGAANDSLAGLGVPVRLASTIVRPTGSPPPYYNYDSGQPWPPGPFKEDFSFTDLLATPSPSVDGTIVHDFHITDRSGLQMQTSMVASYGLFSSGIPDRWEPLEPSLPQPLILGEVIFKVEDVPSFGSCTRLDVPVGMRSKLILEPRNPDPQEIANLNNWLSLFSDTYIQEDYTPIASTSTLFDVSSPTVIAKDFDMVLPRYVKFSTVGYGNTNSVRVQCTYDSDGDGIMDGTYISTMPPGSFFYESGGTVTVKGFALSGPRDQGYAEVVPSGLNVRMVSGSLEIIFSEVLEGGKIFVQRATSYPEIPGYRIDKDNAWDLVVSANYRDLQIKACMNTGALAESQISNAELYHYNSGSGTWEKVTTGRENGCVKGFSQTASPFVVMVPVYDVTAPETSIGFKQGEQRIVDGNFYLSTDTYVNYYAGDLTMRGDISGVATMYSLIDIDPAPGCLATPFDPTALKGTCANPFYTEPFKLAEGIHSLYYFSSDKSFNVESFKSERVYADGTAPETEIAAAGIILAAGTTAAYITDIDSVSITATDPVSNGVASGRKGLLCLINVPPQECAGVQEDPGAPRGTCANPAYASPFSLPVGTHTVYYTAEDNVGNEAEIKSIGVIVGPKIVVTAAAVSTSAIVWSWEPVAGATSYELRSSTGAGISGALPVSATFYLQTGLSPNTLYGNYLKIHSGAGDFVSAAASAATLANLPAAIEVFDFGQGANLVIGQPGFNITSGGTTPNKLYSPRALAFDKNGNLWVSDRSNNRVLRFSPPFSTDMPADLVIGQGDFYTSTIPIRISASAVQYPTGIGFDGDGNLWVLDQIGRILRFSPPFLNGMNADMAIGVNNFYSVGGGCAQNRLNLNTWGEITFDQSGALWAADFDSNRVLRFSPPFSMGMNADMVMGQPNFTTCAYTYPLPPDARGLRSPLAVEFDSKGNAWVADYGSDRVVKYERPFYAGMPASMVLGQKNFAEDNNITGLQGPNAASLAGPASLEFDGRDNLYVVDSGNNRVLKYPSPLSTGMDASLVLGQNDFTSIFNMNMQATFNFPLGVEASGFAATDERGRLWVADTYGNRILMFEPVRRGIFTDIGTSSFSVNWLAGANSAATLYLAEISLKEDFSSGNKSSGFTSQTNYTFTGLAGDTKYFTRVKAVNLDKVETDYLHLGFTFTKSNGNNGNSEIVFMSSEPAHIALVDPASTEGIAALGSAVASGLTIASNLYDINPEGVYAPPAVLMFYYSTSTLASLGLLESDISIYEFYAGAGWAELAGQTLDPSAHKITAPLAQIGSLFGILGVVKDRAAPVTEFVVMGSSAPMPSGGLYVGAQSSISLNAYDPVAYGTSSGVAFTEFRVDADGAAPFAPYSAPFTLSTGSHTVEFRSRDKAGNLEQSNSVAVTFLPRPTVPQFFSPAENPILYSSAPLFLGKTDPGSIVRIFEGQILLGQSLADAGGYFQAAVPMDYGSHLITADAMNELGITSTGTVVKTFTTKAPVPFNFDAPILRPYAPDNGISAAATAVADFDKDEKPDIVMLGGSGYAFLKGDGNGQFATFPKVNESLGYLWHVLPADINRDGNMDVVGVGILNSSILRLLGNGDGTFKPAQWIPTGYSWSEGIALADFNHDGFLDVATKGTVTDAAILIFVGSSDNTFSLASQTGVAVPTAGEFHAVDFNNDGNIDISLGDLILYGDGHGGVSGARNLRGGGTHRSIVEDFNGDGRPDILLVNSSPPYNITPAINIGNGEFAMSSSGNMPSATLAAAAADFNNDGLPDMVLSASSGRMFLLASKGDGLFGEPIMLTIGDNSAPRSIQIGDLNGDGNNDIAAALQPTNNDLVLFFNKAPRLDLTPPSPVYDLAASRDGFSNMINLQWTAPGDNGTTGQAAVYDLRTASIPIISETVFASAAKIGGLPAPRTAGSAETFTVSGLAGGTTCYFALKTADAAGNFSSLSTSTGVFLKFVAESTSTIDGNPEIILSAYQQMTVTPVDAASTAGVIALGTATAQGLFRVSTLYDLRPEGSCEPPAMLTFYYSTAALGGIPESELAVYEHFPDEGWRKLEGQIPDPVNHRITVPVYNIASLFGIFWKASDMEAPQTRLLVSGNSWLDEVGQTYLSERSTIALEAYDPVAYSTMTGVAFTEYRVDADTSTPFTPYSSPFMLSTGTHDVEFRSQDNAGNLETIKSTILFVDGEPPAVRFEVVGTSFAADGVLYAAAGSTVTLISTDGASGVNALYYSVNGGTYTAPSGLAELVLSPGGAYAISYSAEDNVANTSSGNTFDIFIDTTAPASAFNMSGVVGRNGWYVSGVDAAINAFDDRAGVRETLYRLDGSGFTIYRSSFAILMEGRHTMEAYSIDNISNIETAKTITFDIDISTPIIGYSRAPAADANGWNNTPVAVVFTGSDVVSGIEYCSSSFTIVGEGKDISASGYCVDYAGWSSTAALSVNIDTTVPEVAYTAGPVANVAGWNNSEVAVTFTCADGLSGVNSCPADILLPGEGLNISTSAAAYDHAGNAQSILVAGINIDKTAPVSTAAASGFYRNGWYSSSVNIVLTSTDALSGIQGIFYSLDGGGDTAYTQPVAVSSEGEHIIRYYGEDMAGNREFVKTIEFGIDITAPLADYLLSPLSNADGWNTGAVSVAFRGSDTLSGIEECSSVTVTIEGKNQQIAGWCRDLAGNVGSSTATLNVDLTQPVVSATQVPVPNTYGWNNGAVEVSFAGTDVLSGIAYCEPAKIISVEGGSQTISGYCMDYAGWSSTRTVIVNIDKTAPATRAELSGHIESGWYTGAVSIALIPSDEVSGVKQTVYRLERQAGDGAELVSSGTYAVPLSAVSDGIYTVRYYAEDKAGNKEIEQSLEFKIDSAPPDISYNLIPEANSSGWNNSVVEVVFSATNTLSGIKECSRVMVITEGLGQKIVGYCSDMAGNIAYATATVNIDFTRPVSSALQSPAPNTAGWNNSDVRVVFAGSDVLSGLIYCSPERMTSAEGASQIVSGYCADYAGNSSTASITLNIDKTVPLITISSPVAGSLFTAGKDKLGIRLAVDDNLDPAPAVTAVLIQTEDKGAPRGSRPAILAVINGQILDPMDIDDGLWRLEVTAKDIAENSTQAVSGLFEVIHDTIAPETSLLVGEPKFTDTVTFINSGTPLTFSTTDDLLVSGDRQGSGAALTYVARDGGTPAAVPGELFISLEGVHNLAYYSADKAGNTEAAKLAQFSVDNSAPETSHSIFGPVFENAVGLYVSTSSVISFSSVEPLSAGAASGFAAIFIADSTDTYTVSSASFTAAEGAHFYSYYAKDKLGNTEPVRTLALIADGTPPVSAMVFSSAPASGASGRLIISSDTYIGFTRQDALSGVEAVWYSLDNATAAVVVGSITLPVGLHDVSYWSVDNVGNTETAHKVSLQVGVALQNVTINFTPSIINLKSEGGYIEAALSVSSACEAGFDAETIRIIKINDIALAAQIYAIAEHKDKDTKKNTGPGEKPHSLIVKFDRQALIAVLPVDRMVKVTVEGAFDDDSAFAAEDYLRVINPVRVSRGQGEKVRHQSKAFVDIPAKALKTDTDITIVVMAERDTESREREERAEAKNLKRRGEVYEFGPEGTVFDVPVVISLPYDPLEAGKEKPAIAYWNPSKNDWEPLESELDPVEKVVKAKVGHFSLYQVVAPAPAPGDAAPSRSGDNSGAGVLTVSGADATFRLGEVYVFPNPAKGAQVPTFHIETGIADSVSIRIYTVSGRAAHEHTLAGLPAEVDDGNGLSYAYEYAWRDHIPSGVYYYHVEAKKGGQKLKKAGKFAVVR